MRTTSLAGLLLVALHVGCGAISNFADFDPTHSSLSPSIAVAPADGTTMVTLTVQLRYSEQSPAASLPVALSVSGAPAVLVASTGVTDANGVFTTTMTSQSPGTARISARLKGEVLGPALTTSVQFVAVASGASLTMGLQSTVGEPATATVTILDQNGQRVLYYDGTVNFSSTDLKATLPPVYQFTTQDQGQHDFNVVFQTAGAQNVRVADASHAAIAAEVDGINVFIKTAPMLEVSQIASAVAGTVNHVQVRAVNISTHTQTDYTGTVHFSSTDPQASLPPDTTFTAADAGVKVLPITLRTAGFQSVSAVDNNNVVISGIQDAIAVYVQADRFAVTAHGPVVAGNASPAQIAAVDAYGNVDPNYVGTATFISSDVRASLPPTSTWTLADAGSRDVNVTFYTAGQQQFSAQGNGAGFVGTASILVKGGSASSLRLLAPAQAIVGTAATLVATAYDAYGNVSQGYAGHLVLTSSDANATLPAPLDVTPATQGSAIITPVLFAQVGTQTVTVTDANLAQSANAQVVVTHGAPVGLALSGLATAYAGQTQSLQVTALDVHGNPALDYTGTVVISSDDSLAQLPPPTAFTTLDAGTRSVSPVLFETAGLRRVNAVDAANPNIRGTEGNITILPLSASTFVVVAPAQTVAGVAQNVVVRAVDVYGNLDPNFVGRVALGSSDSKATLPGSYMMRASNAGRAVLPITLYTAGTQTITALSGNMVSAPTSMEVSAGTLSKLGVSGLTNGRAGRSQSVVVQALDRYNNLVPSYTGTVQVTSTDPNAVLPGPVVLAAADGGQKLASVALLTAGTQSVAAHDVVTPGIQGTQSGVVVTAVADRLKVSVPSPVTAGDRFNLTVAGVDAYGNIDTIYTGTVALSTTSSGSTLPATLLIDPNMSGVTVNGNFTLTGVGTNLSVTARDTNQAFTGTCGGISVLPAVATSLTVQAPSPIYVGLPFSATLTAYDAYGNQATGYVGGVALTSTDPNANLGTVTTFVSGGQGSAIAAGLVWNTANANATLFATDTQDATIAGGQSGIVVNAGGAAKLRVTGATPGPAGHTDTVTVAAVDSRNNIAVGYTGVVRLTSTDAQAVLPVNYAYTSADAGVHTFSVTWGTSGNQILVAQDTGITGLGGSQNNILITAQAALALQLTDTTSGDIVAGVPRILQIAAIDGFGNVDPNYTGTLTFASSDFNATLPASVSMNPNNAGMVTVGYTLATAGTQWLTGTDGSTPALTGNLTNLQVQPGPAASLLVTGVTDALAGTSNAATITAVDARGNRVPTYAGTVHLSSSDALAVLAGKVTFGTADQGQRSAPLTLFTAGAQSVTAVDTQHPAISGTQSSIHVLVTRTRLRVTTPATVTATQSFSITVAAVDAYGNLDPNYVGTVSLGSSDALALFGTASSSGPGSTASLTFTGADAGQKFLGGVTLYLASSSASISATDTAQSLTGQRSNIVVNPGALDHIAFNVPAGVSPAVAFVAQISAVDNANNVVPGYTGTLALSATDPNATLPSSITVGSADAGSIRVGNLVLVTAGQQTITLIDANGITGNASVTVGALRPAALRVSGVTSGIAGHTDTVTVAAVDAYGNPANGNIGSVTFNSTDPLAVLPGVTAMGTTPSRAFAGVQFETVGTQTLRVAAMPPAGSILVGQQNNIIISHAPASRLTFTGLQDATAGQAQNVVVSATDAYGNLDPNVSGTVTLSSSDPNAVLTTSVTLSGGQAVASVMLKTAGAQAVGASGAGFSGTSPNITIAPAVAARLAVTGVPNGVTGQGATATIAAYDTYGNLATGYLGRVLVSSTDPLASLPANIVFNAADAGSKPAAVAFFTVGTQTLTATDDSNAALTGQQSGIVITAASGRLVLTGPASTGAGQALSVVVQAVTNSNVVDANFTGTVHLTSSDPNATLPANVVFVSADGGQKTLSGFVLATAGNQTVSASTVPSGRSGTSPVIHVTGGATAGLGVFAPREVTAGATFNVKLSAIDAYGNAVPGYTGTVHLSSSDTQATLPTSVTFAMADAGVKTVSAALRTATSNALLQAVDTNNASFTGQQGNITVLPVATESNLTLTGLVAGAAGHTNSVTVSALDSYGNRIPQYRGTVHFASSDALATLPLRYTFTGTDQGVHTFAGVVLATAGNQNVVVTDATASAAQNVIITAAPASFFALNTNHTATSGLAQNVRITATDAYGNIDTNYAGTVTLSSTDPLALLPASYTFVALDAGKHRLPMTWESAGDQTLTATDTAGNSGFTSDVVVAPGATSRLRLVGLTQASTGTPASVTVRATDAAGNLTPSYRGLVHFTSSDGLATLPTDTNYTVNAGGERVLSVTFTTSGNQLLTGTDATTSTITGNVVVPVSAPPKRLRLLLATNTVAGAPAPFTVQVMDNFNNLSTGYTGTVLLTSSDAQATYGNQATFSPSDGGNKVVAGAFKTSGSQSLIVMDSQGTLTSASSSIVVAPAGTSYYDVGVAAPTVVAGGNVNLALVSRDAYANLTPAYAGTARITSSDVTAVLPANVTFSGGTATPGSVRVTRAGNTTSFTATDVNQTSIFGTSTTVTVTPMSANSLLVSGATSGVAGHVQNVTVSARDIYNNLVTAYRGNVAVTSSDAAATLPSNYTFSAGDAGAHTFAGLALATVGNQSLTVSDVQTPSVLGQQTGIAITASAATHLVWSGPSSTTAGVAQNANVTALDAYGNVDPNFRGTLTWSSSDPQASLPASYPYVAADAGNHVFTLTLATVGTQTVTAASGGLSSGQISMAVSPAATRRLVLGGLLTGPAGTVQSLNVRATDNYNNITPSYRGSVAFSSSDARATVPGNYAYLSGDAGSKNFTATLLTQGLAQVRVVDTSNPNLASAQNAVVTVAQTQLVLASDTNVIAGVAFNATLRAMDAYGNMNPNYTGTVHFTSSDPNASLPADVHFSASNQGVVALTQQATFRTAGASQVLTATDTNGLTGSQMGIVVNPAPAARIAVNGPATVVAGVTFNLGVAAYDAYNNVATGYTGRVSFSASDANATLPAANTFTLADQGNKTFSNIAQLTRVGAQLITVNDTNNMLTGSTPMTVQSATASALALSGPTTVVAGTPLTLALTAYDAYGNVATGMSDTVVVSGSDMSASYPAPVAFTPTDAGMRTLTNLTTLRTAGLVSVTVSDANNPGVNSASTFVVVTPSSVSTLVIHAPSSVTAATNFNATVAAVDTYLNVVNNYTASVPLLSTDTAGVPSTVSPLTVAFTSGNSAQRTLNNVTLKTAGPQQLTAADPNNSAISGFTGVLVNAGSPNALALSISPNVTAGQATNVTVRALDAGGNLSPNFVGTVTFSSTDANATLPGPLSLTSADQGQKTVSGSLVWHQVGVQTLTANGGGLAPGSASTTVSAGSVVGLQLYGLGNLLAGTNNQATVRAIDTYGNTSPSYTGTVAWTSSDPAASLPSALTFSAADAGSKTAAMRLFTAGSQSVTASDAANSLAATQNNIIVGVQASRFVVVSPNSVTAGTPMAITVSATDAYGNIDPNFTGSLHFTSTNANASFPAGISFAASDHGQRSIAGIVLTAVSPNATVTVLNNANSIVGTSNPTIVTPGNANRLSVVTAASVPAGSPLTATVTAYDAWANVATGYTGTVAVTTNNANAVLPAPASFPSNANGVINVSGIYLLNATPSATVTFTDTTNANITGSQTAIQVTPLSADHFVLTGLTSGVAGHTGTLNVVARDIYNNIATSYRGTVGFTSTDSAANLPTNYAFVGADQGFHAFSGVYLATTGTQSVTARDTVQASLIGTQSGIVITGSSANHLNLAGAANTVAGQTQNIVVTAVDAYGNTDPNFTGAVSFTTTDANATLAATYTFSGSDLGAHTLPLVYRLAGTQTLTATGPTAVGSAQTNTQVNPNNANSYIVSGIPNTSAGQATTVTVRVIDAYNNTVPLYRGQAHFASSDTNAVLPSNYTFVAADNGIKSLGLTLTTSGTQWVSATDTNVLSITGIETGIVVGAAQSHLQVTSNTNVVAGVAFPITVTALDAFGNTDTGYAGTIHFTSGDVNATLPGDITVTNANNGSVTLSGAILRTATTNQRITATDTNVSSKTGAQSGIQVSPAAVSTIVLTAPSTATAGSNFTGVVTAYDAFSNVATGYAGTVAFASSDTNAVLPANSSFGASSVGTRTFTNGLVLAHTGNQTISVADTNVALASVANIVVGAGPTTQLVLSTPASSTAGNVIVAQVQAQDAYGNVAPSYRGTVNFSSGDPNASYPPSYIFSASDNGNHTFNANLILRQAGAQVVNVVDANSVSVGAGTSFITVNPATINTFRVTTPPSVAAGDALVVTFAGLDIYGNVANTYNGTAVLTSSDANGTPSPTAPINYPFSAGTSVQRTTSGVQLSTSGNQTVYVRDANSPATLSGQANVLVTPRGVTSFGLTASPNLTAGQPSTLTLRAYDSYGNAATSYTATVFFSSADANSLLPASYAFLASDKGVHAFSNAITLYQSGTRNVTVTDSNGLTQTFSLSVSPGNANMLVWTAPATAVAGTPLITTVTAYDRWGNLATGYRGTVTFGSNDSNAVLPSAYAFVSADSGAHVFNGNINLRTAGNRTLLATDSNAGANVGPASANVLVNANVVASLAFSSYPTVWVAGTNTNLTMTALDAYGNTATGYTGTVQLGSSDTYASLPVNRTFVTADHGIATVTARLNSISMASNITAADIATPSLSGNTMAVRVDPAPTASAPPGVTGLTANVFHRGTDQSLAYATGLSDMVTAATYFYQQTPNYSFTDSYFSSTLNMSYSGADGTAFNTFLGSDAAGSATSDSNGLQTTYLDYAGYVHVTTGGNYTFSLSADNAAVVWMGGGQAPGVTTMTMGASSGAGALVQNFNNPLVVHYPQAGYYPVELFYVNQTCCSGLGSAGLSFQISGPGTISVLTGPGLFAEQPFTDVFNFNNTAQMSYAYDTTQISMGRSSAYLSPIYTRSGDNNSTSFNAGAGNSITWDANGYARLTRSGSGSPYIFYTSFEAYDIPLTWTSTPDAGLGSSNITGVCCGLTAGESFSPASPNYTGSSAMLYSGAGNGGSTTYTSNQLFSFAGQGFNLDANSFISYWIYPQSHTANFSVNGNNSLYMTLDVVFSDGTDTKSVSSIVDANGIRLHPTFQGNGGKIGLDKWNYVRADLSALAGKTIDHLSWSFQLNGATGGFRGTFDDIFLSGTSTVPRTNIATLDASWTPAWSNIIGYWPMDGAGLIANNANVPSSIGVTLKAHNNNGNGMSYANGILNQGIYLDGIDDYLEIPVASFPNSTTMTVSTWHKNMNSSTLCPRVFEFGSSSNRTGVYPNCNNSFTMFQEVFSSPSYTSINTSPSIPLPPGTWTHYVATVDANNRARLYINGELYGSSTWSQPLTTVAAGTAYIGASESGFDYYARGFFDEFAVWNVALTRTQIESIYKRQSARYSGLWTSRVMPTPFQGAAATGFGWTSTLPYGKQLPSNGLSEPTTAYTALASNALEANLLTLWHFDETALNTVPGGDFYDDTGSGNVGKAYAVGGTLPTVNIIGNFNRAIHIYAQSQNDMVVGQVGMAAPSTMTLQVWFRKLQQTSGLLAGFGDSSTGTFSSTRDRMLYMNTSGQLVYYVYSGGAQSVTSPSIYLDGRWHHAVATLSSAGMNLYVDGALVGSNTAVTSGQSYTGYLHAGCDSLNGLPSTVSDYCFGGELDEVAVWNRALTAQEIFQLWRRGADRVKYQVKICQASDCSDIAAWSGYDGTTSTWFSELNNLPGISGLPDSAALQFATASPNLVVNANYPYLQYRMALETDDGNQLCNYGGNTRPCSPEINSTQFFRVNYSTSSPSVANVSGMPYYTLQSLSGALGAAGCPGGVTYMLSPDGVNDYYYNGLSWTASNGTLAQSNTPAQITQNAMNVFSTQFPFGQTYFQALMTSNGVAPCALASVTWTGTH